MKDSLVQVEDVEMIPVEDVNPMPAVEPSADEVVNSPLGLFPAPMSKEQAASDAGE